MKIRIIGSCGSGKSTAARTFSERFNIPFYEIDNITWDRSAENLRYPVEVRDETFRSIIDQDAWIVEGVHLSWTMESFRQADFIIILHPHVLVRDYRIIRRFIRSRAGIEPWNYKQSAKNLWKMISKWNHGYNINEVFEATKDYTDKRYVVKRNADMMQCIEEITKALEIKP
ncbi:hypothetical protein [Paenibacillus sp. KN14-4R]|uniref:hypothetical protein n=1 Tax=Paenibacillus sp. KN14-4R TaxID=3445773 RepID=UPI003FA0CD81